MTTTSFDDLLNQPHYMEAPGQCSEDGQEGVGWSAGDSDTYKETTLGISDLDVGPQHVFY